MSEIRDKVKERIASLIRENVWLHVEQMTDPQIITDSILSLSEIAVVDRKAKPPTLAGAPSFSEDYADGYNRVGRNMLKEGWVKEVM